jgi:DNA-directed RNA polymerase specialized sigma24 family protein
LKILEGRAVFNSRSSFKTWLFSVIRNTARDQLQKERIRSVVLSKFRLQPGTHPDPDEEMSFDAKMN